MSTATMERVVTERIVDTSNDKPNSSHIVMVPPNEDDESPQAYTMRARIEGFAIVALCGYVFIPKQSAMKLPVCTICKDIYETVGSDLEDRKGRLPDE